MAIDVSLITLQMTQGEAISLLGEPLQQTDEQELHVLWYSSPIPGQGDYLYFKNDQLVKFTLNTEKEYLGLNTYVEKYGIPERSTYIYDDTLQDSLTYRQHIWFSQGIAVLTTGESTDSLVVREEYFASQKQEEYLQGIGKELADKKEISLFASPQPNSVLIQSPGVFITQNNLLTIALVAVVLISVAIIVVIIKRRTRPKIN